MNDDHSPSDVPLVDDELVSAVLDGEATADERALVEGSPEGRRRLEQLRVATAAVAEEVPSLDPETTDALITRALDAATAPDVEGARPAATSAASVASDEVAARRRRSHRSVWRRVGGAAAAVAAVGVLVVGIAALARTSGRSSSDTAASSSAESSGASTSATAVAGAQADAARPSAASVPPDLGASTDPELVLDRYVVLLGLHPEIDHQFDASSGSSSSAPVPGDAAARSLPSCPLPPVPTSPGESWTVAATASLPAGPAIVMTDGVASPGNRVLVVDASTCAVLAERTI